MPQSAASSSTRGALSSGLPIASVSGVPSSVLITGMGFTLFFVTALLGRLAQLLVALGQFHLQATGGLLRLVLALP